MSVRVIQIDHGKANALDPEFLTWFDERLSAAEADADCRAAVLTGRGAIFSAGLDLYRLLEEGPGFVEEFVPAFCAGFERLFSFPKPIVAAINGHAIAGGCVIACACDLRLMAAGGGKIGVPELRVGVPFPSIALEIVRHVVGAAHFEELILGGATYPPHTARDRGLIDAVVAREDLLAEAERRAAELGTIDPESYAISKRQLRTPALERVGKSAELDREIVRVWSDSATADRIRAYLRATLGSDSR